MRYPLQFTIVLGLAAGVALAASDSAPQSKSEAAAVREAIRFERAKDAAARRQLRVETSYPGQQASEANRSAESRARSKARPPKSR